MSHGGRRSGAGRKAGTLNRRTQEILAAASENGITPLELMTNLMREHWNQGTAESKEKAAYWAERCAPYYHPKLAAVEHSGDKDNPVGIALLSAVPRDDADTDDDQPAKNH